MGWTIGRGAGRNAAGEGPATAAGSEDGRDRRRSRCRRECRRRDGREPADGRRDVGSRGQLGHQHIDLLASPTLGPGEDRFVILRREVAAQQPHGGEGDLSRGQQVEDHRETPAGAGGVDPSARGVFG